MIAWDTPHEVTVDGAPTIRSTAHLGSIVCIAERELDSDTWDGLWGIDELCYGRYFIAVFQETLEQAQRVTESHVRRWLREHMQRFEEDTHAT